MRCAIVDGETGFWSFLSDLHPNLGLDFSFWLFFCVKTSFGSFLGDLLSTSGLGFSFWSFFMVRPVFSHFWVICSLNQVWLMFWFVFCVETSFGSFLGDLQPKSGIGLCFGYFFCDETRFSSFLWDLLPTS